MNKNFVIKWYYLLFLYFFYNLNLIFIDYSRITSLCVLSEIINGIVNGMYTQIVFYGLRV